MEGHAMQSTPSNDLYVDSASSSINTTLLHLPTSTAAASRIMPFGDSETANGAPQESQCLSSGRRTSRVWRYFRMVDNCHYVCCLCNFIGAYTNTTNMRKHIQNHHPERFQDILDHTRPTNRLHYLRSFVPHLLPLSSTSQQYQQYNNINPGQTFPSGSLSLPATEPHDHNFCTISEGDSSFDLPLTTTPNDALREQNNGRSNSEPITFESSLVKVSQSLPNSKTKNEVTNRNFGEDRKVDLSSFGGANSASSGGQNENSLGSGDIHGPADEVSVPLSPEQFLTEEMEHGVSPPTPTQRPESYKLRHNNHLSLVLESLAGDESFMDVTLTAQGKAIKAHKSVLSAVSPYFRSVLKENPCQHPIIIMPRDIRFEELNNIISYVYKGEMTVAAEELSSLLKTAEVLQVTGLSPSETVGSTSGSFIGQTQGLPSGICPSTPLICSPNAYFNYKTSSKKSTDQVTASQQNEDIPQNAIQSESRERIDPLDFLNADMTCVKEEITSEDEEMEESNGQPTNLNSMVSSVHAGSSREYSAAVDDSNTSGNNVQIGVRRNSFSPYSSQDGCSIQNANKTFNPGDGLSATSAEESHASSATLAYVCPYCCESHRPTEALQVHLRLKHPSKPSFICDCGKVFTKQILLTDHKKKCDL